MSRLLVVNRNRKQRQGRVRATVNGTKDRPRLCIRVSNRHISAQIIDDTKGQTLIAATTATSSMAKGSMTEKATWLGEEIAKKAKSAKVKKVVLDRGSKLYHGRVAAVADTARKSGLEF